MSKRYNKNQKHFKRRSGGRYGNKEKEFDGDDVVKLPILEPDAQSWVAFKEASIDRFGTLYNLESYFQPGGYVCATPRPTEEDFASSTTAAAATGSRSRANQKFEDEIDEAVKKKRIEDYAKAIADDQRNAKKVYREIWAKLSKSSQALIQAQAEFDDHDRKSDLAWLWTNIIATHMGAKTGESTDDKARLRREFATMRQRQNEDIHAFKERYDGTKSSLKTFKIDSVIPADPKDEAADFILKIDQARYPTFMDYFNGQVRHQGHEYPFKTVEEVYQTLMKHAIEPGGDVRPPTRGRYPNNNSRRTSGEAVFSATSKEGRRGNGNGRKPKFDFKKLDKSQDGCWICGAMDHHYRQCPDCESSSDNDKKKKKNSDSKKKEEAKHPKKQSTFFTSAAPPKSSVMFDGYSDEESETSRFVQTRDDESVRSESEAVYMARVKEEERIDISAVQCLQASNRHEDDPKMDDVLFLDSGASRSIIRNETLCSETRTQNKVIRFTGIAGSSRTTNVVGDLLEFGEVVIFPGAHANCLSLGELGKRFPKEKIGFKNNRWFEIRVSDDLVYRFRKTTKNLYACVLSDEKCVRRRKLEPVLAIDTETQREAPYTKREIANAKVARDLVVELGCPSPAVLMKLCKGFMKNVPITAQDVYNSFKIYGPLPGAVKGKYRQINPPTFSPEYVPKPVVTDLVMFADIMFIAGEAYLITITKPLGLLIISHLADRAAPLVAKALNAILKNYLARKFTITAIKCDGEGGLSKLRDPLAEAGILLEPVGAGSHVGTIEVQIKLIKESFRSVLHGLPYRLPSFLYRYLVYFCVGRRNMLPSNVSSDPTPPRELFTGRRLDYKIDVRIGFGEYVEIDAMQKQKNDPTKPRTLPAISLDPKGTLNGSVRFFVLQDPEVVYDKATKKEKLSYSFCVRDRWVKMGMSPLMIDKMNAIAYDNANVYPPPDLKDLDEERTDRLLAEAAKREIRMPSVGMTGQGHVPVEDVEDPIDEEELVQDEPRTAVAEVPVEVSSPPVGDVEQPPVMPMEISSLPGVSESVGGTLGEVGVSESSLPADGNGDGVVSTLPGVVPGVISSEGALLEQDPEPPPPPIESVGSSVVPSRVSSRSTKGIRAIRFGEEMNLIRMFHISLKKGLKKYGDAAKLAASGELGQMLKLMVWDKVDKKELATVNWRKVIRSFMFLKEKFKPDGSFDKLKMRLVAGGNFQDKFDYDNISSPTVLLATVLIILAVSVKKKYKVVTTDVAGAFLNAFLKNKGIYMLIEPVLASIVVELDPSYREYLLPDGSLLVRLVKALYGCIESARLWYELLSKTLMEFGLVRSNYDCCLFYSAAKDMYVTIYVDDIMIAAEKDEDVQRLLNYLRDKFKNITVDEGSTLSYLGMSFTLDYDEGQVRISMERYVEEVLQVCDVEGNSRTPAHSDLFNIDFNSPPLSKKQTEHFHSMVAKLLYLAKRVRPDILTAISFLATRVREPTEQDLLKLQRVCKYIRCTKDKCITLKAGEGVMAYVDASHAVHNKDGRSHTGVYVTLGEGPVFVRSTKQKLTTKSSTEAELVALSDALPMLLWIREMLIEIGYIGKDEPIKIWEDNMSTIALVKRGSPSSESTRHINIRFFFISDRVQAGHVAIEYCKTENMLADYFTKALVGSVHHRMAGLIMNQVARD